MAVETFEKWWGGVGGELIAAIKYLKERRDLYWSRQRLNWNEWIEMTGKEIWALNKKKFPISGSGVGVLKNQWAPNPEVITLRSGTPILRRKKNGKFLSSYRTYLPLTNCKHRVDTDLIVCNCSKEGKKDAWRNKWYFALDWVGVFSLFWYWMGEKRWIFKYSVTSHIEKSIPAEFIFFTQHQIFPNHPWCPSPKKSWATFLLTRKTPRGPSSPWSGKSVINDVASKPWTGRLTQNVLS